MRFVVGVGRNLFFFFLPINSLGAGEKPIFGALYWLLLPSLPEIGITAKKGSSRNKRGGEREGVKHLDIAKGPRL